MAIKLVQCCIGASTHRVVHSTEAMVEHMVEMTRWSTGNGTEVQKAKEEV